MRHLIVKELLEIEIACPSAARGGYTGSMEHFEIRGWGGGQELYIMCVKNVYLYFAQVVYRCCHDYANS